MTPCEHFNVNNNLQLCHQHQEDQLHQDLQAHPAIHNKTGNPIKGTSFLGRREGDYSSLIRITRLIVSNNEEESISLSVFN